MKNKMTKGIKVVIDQMDSKIRKIDRSLEKCELREKQLIVMFKMILDKYHHPHRGKQRQLNMQDIIQFMEQLVNKNLTPSELKESPDLISELF